jgi:hypothetical protein
MFILQSELKNQATELKKLKLISPSGSPTVREWLWIPNSNEQWEESR